MRKLVLALLLMSLIAGGVSWVWASCNAMSSYRNSRPDYSFYVMAAQAQASAIAAERQRMKALRLETTKTRIAALANREQQLDLLAQESRRDNLEEKFARAHKKSEEERLREAQEWYDLGVKMEGRRNISAASDYYLFAMQMVPGTTLATQAHEALKRLDAFEQKVGNDARAMNTNSVLSQRDLEQIRAAGGAAFVANEGVQQMLDAIANEENMDRLQLIIQKLRDEKGGEYSEGMVQAIAILPAEAKPMARKALAERFMRLTTNSLKAKLAADTESRQAAIQVVAAQKLTELAPDLARLLTVDDAAQRQASLTALKQMTGQDFGPAPDASFTERFVAQKKWLEWLSR